MIEEVLAGIIRRASLVPLCWHYRGHDCASLSNYALRMTTGVDLFARHGVFYRSRREALRVLASWSGPVEAVERLVGDSLTAYQEPRRATIGSLVALSHQFEENAPWLGVHTGRRVLVAAEVGVELVSLDRIVKAWKVNGCQQQRQR